ncbi:MAG: hypothetical protein ACRDQA_15360 [Nocardioidaceae bacterium]
MWGSDKICVAVVASMVALLAASCSSAEDVGGSHSGLDAALAVVPATAVSFTYLGLADSRDRWGLGDITSATPTDSKEMHQLIDKSMRSGRGAGFFAQWQFAMLKSWGWSDLDADWEVQWTGGEDSAPPATVIKLRGDLDMDTVTDSFTDHGYKSSKVNGHTLYRRDPSKSDVGAAVFFAAVVLPDKHLVISSSEPKPALAVIDGGADSLADSDLVDRLTNGVDAAEYVNLARGAAVCRVPIPSDPSDPDKVKAQYEKMRARDIHAIDGVAAVLGDRESAATVVTDFPTAAAAEADQKVRPDAIMAGHSMRSDRAYSDIFTIDNTTVEGRMLRYDLTFKQPAGVLAQMIINRDAPWAFCPV